MYNCANLRFWPIAHCSVFGLYGQILDAPGSHTSLTMFQPYFTIYTLQSQTFFDELQCELIPLDKFFLGMNCNRLVAKTSLFFDVICYIACLFIISIRLNGNSKINFIKCLCFSNCYSFKKKKS